MDLRVQRAIGAPGSNGTPGAPGTPCAPGPGLTGAFYSDWEAISEFSYISYSPNTCYASGFLKNNDKLLEAAHQNGIILIYQKTGESKIYSIPRANNV